MRLCGGNVRGGFGRRIGVMAIAGLVTWAGLTLSALSQSIDSVTTFDVPAQPLGTALTTLAIQANLQIFFEQAPVEGLRAPAVQGSMTTQQALQTMLTDSPLTFRQNDDGTLVVLRKVRTAARSPARKSQPAPPASPAPAPSAAPVASVIQTAREREGAWMLRARAAYLAPHNTSDAFSVPSAPATLVSQNGARAGDRWAPELDAEYFFNSWWSSEVALSYPQVHDLSLRGAISTSSTGKVGSFRLSPNFLTLKFNFLPDAPFRPYLGLGINVTALSAQNASPFGLSKTTAGPAAQAGFDIRLSDHWSLNADAKWSRSRPAIDYTGETIGHMKLDPVLLGLGIGYRFGGAPPHSPLAAKAAPIPAPVPLVDSDGDGVPDSMDRCPNTPPGVKVDANGCPLDADNDGVPDYLDQCPGTPAGLKVDALGCEIEELILKGVTFDTNSAHLTAESAVVLDSVVLVLRQRPKAHTEIHGYTDSRGSDVYNQNLSERRAAAVVQYLVEHGIAGPNLSARGFGKANPVASNETAEGRAQNRRVTVEFSRPVPRA